MMGAGGLLDGIVGVHTLSFLLSSRVPHDRAAEDNHTHESRTARNRNSGTELLAGTVHKPRQGGIKSIPL